MLACMLCAYGLSSVLQGALSPLLIYSVITSFVICLTFLEYILSLLLSVVSIGKQLQQLTAW
jgi:hypothetical protein